MSRLSDRTLRWIGYGLAFWAVLMTPVSIWLNARLGDGSEVVTQVVLGLTFGVVLVVVVTAQPRNGTVWALLLGALGGATSAAAGAFVELRLNAPIQDILDAGLDSTAPSELDLLTSLSLFWGSWAFLAIFALTIHLVLLFPDGHLPSRFWRFVGWGTAGAIALAGIQSARYLGPWIDAPYDRAAAQAMNGPIGVIITALLLTGMAALVQLVVSYRRSSGITRLQYRWVTFAVALNVVPWWALSESLLPELVADIVFTASLAAIPISLAIAITRYRLFDIDLVISRTLLFAGLIGFITLVYAGLVAGLGSVVGGANLGWSIAATAIVAVVFEPVRNRIQRWVNRLIYGQRATPYEVLADLTGRLARTEREEGLLDRMATRVAEGTGADRVVVWAATADGFEPLATEPTELAPRSAETSLRDLPGVAVPIEHDGEVLGALSVETRRDEALSGTERRLIDDLTGSVGLAMRRSRLDEELERKAQELADSRRRLVGAQDEERRRLERELGRGVQQQVMALREQLDLAVAKVQASGLDQVVVFLNQMSKETQDAIDQIRALAHGIYPPLLEADGLTAAVIALGDLAPVEVEVHHDVARRHPLPVEAAAYFCASEALTNAIKHGRPPIVIELSDVDGDLRFQVSDAGPGFDPATTIRGSGLNNLNDRLDALGGSVTIDSAQGRPTVIRGRLPLNTAVDAVPAAAGV